MVTFGPTDLPAGMPPRTLAPDRGQPSFCADTSDVGDHTDSLVAKLARVYVPAHVREVGGKVVHVEEYTRTVPSGFRGTVRAGIGEAVDFQHRPVGEGARGPEREIEYGDLDRQGRPQHSGPLTKWTQDDGVVLERGVAYQWDLGGATYTGTFAGYSGGGGRIENDRPAMRDVEVSFRDGGRTEMEMAYAPRSGVRSLEDVDREVREAAAKAGMSPIEYLRSLRTPSTRGVTGEPAHTFSQGGAMGEKTEKLIVALADRSMEYRKEKPTAYGTSFPIGNVVDLKAAIQSFGRAPEDKKATVKAFIKRRAKELGRTDLIPEDW